jgi:hypothetical protein
MMTDLLSRVIGVPETRSPEQVRREVAEEFAHHQECLREELRQRGVPEAELEASVAKRFGDVGRLARACARVALKERIMLQRINLVLLLVVGLAVAWTAWNTERSSTKSAAALDRLAERLDALAGSGRAPMVAAAVTPGQTEGYVVVHGLSAERPGLYAVPRDGSLTVRRLLAAAGFTGTWGSSEAVVKVLRMTPDMKNECVFSMTQSDYQQSEGKDVVLRPGDLVEVP